MRRLGQHGQVAQQDHSRAADCPESLLEGLRWGGWTAKGVLRGRKKLVPVEEHVGGAASSSSRLCRRLKGASTGPVQEEGGAGRRRRRAAPLGEHSMRRPVEDTPAGRQRDLPTNTVGLKNASDARKQRGRKAGKGPGGKTSPDVGEASCTRHAA